MSQAPENTVVRSEYDASMVGLYASLVAGGLMLAYAIWYVTVVNVDNDYSFLTLGFITGATAVSVIGLHEWMRNQAGPDRPENPIEEYGGAIAVLMGALSVVWLSRFAVFYAGQEKEWIAIQDGDVWMPVWLSVLQAVGILVVMEISTRNIRRHSLGTLPRTVVVLAPLAVLFSGVKIWLEYSRGEVETFITLSVILLSGSAVLYSLRLDRAILYLMSSGAAVGLPIFIALSSWGETEHASLLVPAVVIVGITATDRSLSKKMIENGSGAVVAAILFCQILAADETQFSLAGNAISEHPFGLTFWLWVALLVGWFAPTTMQRTPAMPVGLALALALLSDEAAMVAWAVGICAFVYLETRPQARDWVVRATYLAMVVSWTVSSFIGAGNGGNILEIGPLDLSIVDGISLVIFPSLLALGIWAQMRGRLRAYEGPSILLALASLNMQLLQEAGPFFLLIISAASLFQLNWFLSLRSKDRYDREWFSDLGNLALLSSPLVLSSVLTFGDQDLEPMILALPLILSFGVFGICHRWRVDGESLVLRPEMVAMLLLVLVFLLNNIHPWEERDFSTETVSLTLACLGLLATLLAVEGGAVFRTTPFERMVGITYLFSVSVVSVNIISWEGAELWARITRDLIIIAAPAVVNFRLKALLDLSQEARNFGSLTLFGLLLIGMTDSSGGLLALPVFAIAVQRAAKHVSTPVLVALPAVAVIYASFFDSLGDESDLIWALLNDIPYLGETTDILLFETPRWVSLLLLSIPASVAIHLPSEKEREGGSRYGPEQLFGPAVAVLLSVAFLLPDPQTAPIVIVAVITAGAWRQGVINWFWISPIAWFWSSMELFQYLEVGQGSDYARVVGGLAGFSQYLLFHNGLLLANSPFEGHDEGNDEFLGLASRGYGYAFLLISGGLSGALPFISALVAGWDGIRTGTPIVLHGSVLVQTLTLESWLRGDFGFQSEDALVWPIAVGIAMVALSWRRTNPYGREVQAPTLDTSGSMPFDVEKDFGIFGSAFFLIAMFPYSDYIEVDFAFGASIVLLSLHHVIVGFGRDHGWRRLMSLIGMPMGLLVTGAAYEGLIMVLMLFLAALTLIGQAVLYASRGGLEIGSTIEGAAPIASNVGVSAHSLEPSKPKQEPTEVSEEPENEDDASSEEAEEEAPDPEPVKSQSPLFESEEAPFGIRLEPNMMNNLGQMISTNRTVDFSKWSPVLAISSNGSIVLNWEKSPEEE